MKKIYRTVLLGGVLLALASCNGKDPVEPVDPNQNPAVQPETRTLTFVLPEITLEDGEGAPEVLKQRWAAGDQIVVHGEYAADQVVVTLAAGDISADGKSAIKTVDGLMPYTRDDCTSTLYASYPASAVDNLRHCFFYSKFSTTNAQLMAACNTGDTFQFQNLCGLLSFTVEGGFEQYLISTPKKEALGYEFLQVKLTDREQNFKQYTGDPVLSIEGRMDGDEVLICLPEGTQLSSGLTVKLMQDGAYTQILKITDPVEVARGTIVDLGDLTGLLQHYDDPFSADILDLDADGNANCYIVTAPGSYKFKAVTGNKATAFVEEPYDATVLWETWNDDSEVTEGSVLASASYAEDYIIIHTGGTLTPGNAGVAVRNADGEILWSWHIWIPETAVATASYGGIMGADLMDRNLGALVVTEDGNDPVDPRSYGLMYQWGRKDPFTAAGTFNGSSPATCAGEQDEVAAAQITLEESVAHPRRLGHINNGDWLISADDGLWSDTDKTIYDPCPPGYRVPPMNTSAPFWSSDLTTQAGWGVNVAAGWLKIGSPEAGVFPIAGYRDDYSVGGLSKVGVRTLYWVSYGSGASGSGANLRSDSKYTFGSAPKSRLGSVRCVVEQ